MLPLCDSCGVMLKLKDCARLSREQKATSARISRQPPQERVALLLPNVIFQLLMLVWDEIFLWDLEALNTVK